MGNAVDYLCKNALLLSCQAMCRQQIPVSSLFNYSEADLAHYITDGGWTASKLTM